jgi:LuxR family quorum sensing-dependent transcriptional regulator
MHNTRPMVALTNTMLDAVQALQRAPSILKVKEILRQVAHPHGFEHFLCWGPSDQPLSPGLAMFENWPTTWRRCYLENRLYVNDPIFEHSQQTPHPFLWSEVTKKGMSPAAARTMALAASFGLREGFVVPIYGIGGQLHGMTLAGRTPSGDVAARAELHLISMYAYARAKQLQRREPEPTIRLTPREREAVQWAAIGKTDWEIGELVGISESAAHKRIESAKRKFGVATRIQAVVEALRRGYIQL